MRVLITNHRLDRRAGTQTFVRELARGLEALGHSVVAYSSDPGQQERLLESDLLPVATRLEDLPLRPDVIHAQHHLDAMTALTALPEVPAVYHCHGAVWRESPPRHPRIVRYLAMSPTLAERMVVESGLPPEDIEVVPNGVDLERFRTVRKPPAGPTRALFYNGHHRRGSPTVEAVREACAACGVELDFVGKHFGTWVERPEVFLPRYDLVFASGRSAIDALACGCAVVVLGRTSCGGLVTSQDSAAQRRSNFSIAVNSAPPSAARITAEIRRYSAEDAAAVTRWLREEADSRRTVARLVGIYGEVIERHRRTPRDPDEELRAVSRYLRRLAPLIKQTDEAQARAGLPLPLGLALDDLAGRLDGVRRDVAEAVSALEGPGGSAARDPRRLPDA